jgi:hypothetical protein
MLKSERQHEIKQLWMKMHKIRINPFPSSVKLMHLWRKWVELGMCLEPTMGGVDKTAQPELQQWSRDWTARSRHKTCAQLSEINNAAECRPHHIWDGMQW